MMSLVILGVLAWGFIFAQIDRASTPAYLVRNAYRWATVLLFVGLLVVGWKAAAWHTELVTLLRWCHP